MKKIVVTLALCLLLSGCNGNTDITNTQKEMINKQTTTESNKTNEEAVKEMSYEQFEKPVAGEEIIVMKTSMGEIKLRLFPQYAPKAVENFKGLAQKGYYNGLIFHRVMDDFMIQGGDPLGTGTGGESIWGKPFEDEFDQDILNFRGALSMANSGPDTNGSQFFIVQKPTVEDAMLKQLSQVGAPKEVVEAYKTNGGTPWLDGRHTVFGQVFEGMEVVDKIALVKVGNNDKPVEEVKMLTVNVEKYSE